MPLARSPACPAVAPACSTTLAFSGILSQTEMLTFILFWTLANNVVHLF